MNLRALLKEPVFWAGLVIKLALVALAVPAIRMQWFVPFLQEILTQPSIDPWSEHLSVGGDPMAFPYGPIMYVVLLPGVLIGTLLNWALHTSWLEYAGFGMTVLALDLAVLLLLPRLVKASKQQLLYWYWLSPIVMYVCYWHGQSDMVPLFFLVVSLVFLRQYRVGLSGLALGLAVAAKLSMLLAIPFLGIYLLRSNRLRHLAPSFFAALVATVVVLQGSYLLSPGVRAMVLGSPELGKVFSVAIPVGDVFRIYVLPIAYMLLVYTAWQMRRMSYDLLFAFTGLAFFLVLLLTPASVGWYLWTVPFLFGFQVSAGRPATVLVGLFSALLLGYHLTVNQGVTLPLLNIDLSQPLAQASGAASARAESLWLSVIAALGLIMMLRMYQEGILRNDYYRLSRRPVMIGIAGDSGSGKDTLGLSLANLFGAESVARLSGDDYHKWDRHAPIWRSVTHLNPRANNLADLAEHALALLDGQAVYTSHYDHGTGRFAPKARIQENDCIIISGLHALDIPALSDRYHVSVYLDMDEDLRRYFKMRRDVTERGHAPERVLDSIQSRMVDGQLYVRPQSQQADIVFHLTPVNPHELSDTRLDREPRLRLVADLRRSLQYDRIVRTLMAIPNVYVDSNLLETGGGAQLTLEGDPAPEDVEWAAQRLVPHIQELLSLRPAWSGGVTGLMQLITLVQITQTLQQRLQ